MEIEVVGTHVLKKTRAGDKLTINIIKNIQIYQLVVKEAKEDCPIRVGSEFLRIKKSDILKKWTGTNKAYSATIQFVCALTKYGYIIGEQYWACGIRDEEVYMVNKIIDSLKEFDDFIKEEKDKYTGGEYAWVLYNSMVPGHPEKRQPTIMRIEDNDDKRIDAIGPNGEQGIFVKSKGMSVFQPTVASYKVTNNLGVEFDAQIDGLNCGVVWFIYQGLVYKGYRFMFDDIRLNHDGKQTSIGCNINKISNNNFYAALNKFNLSNNWIVNSASPGLSLNQYKRARKMMNKNKYTLDDCDIEMILQEALMDITEEDKNRLIRGV